MTLSYLEITAVHKRFGGFTALHEVSLSVARGSFVSLLGPSGCGKTTLLRIIAGLERPQRGRLVLDGTALTEIPPERRGIAMMFQSYALLPHMTVLENVRFPLRMQRTETATQQRERARAALEMVKLDAHAGKLPRQLSGGQQQRVALARAIVGEPKLLLLDEPLSNLDARLREDMQIELKDLQHRLGITTILVTHDQEEALSLSDRIVLMREGNVEQIGTALELYSAPATAFAADFIGAANLIPVSVTHEGERWIGRLADGQEVTLPDAADMRPGERKLVVRQEDIRIAAQAPDEESWAAVAARVQARIYLGATARLVFQLGDGQVKVLSDRSAVADLPPDPVLAWPVSSSRLVD